MAQDEITTTLSEDLRSLLDEFDGGKITEETVIEAIGNIAKFYENAPKVMKDRYVKRK